MIRYGYNKKHFWAIIRITRRQHEHEVTPVNRDQIHIG